MTRRLLSASSDTVRSAPATKCATKKIAVIGSGDHGMRAAVFLRSFTADVSLVSSDGDHDLSEAARADLLRHSVKVLDGPIEDFVIHDDGIAMRTPTAEMTFDAAYPALGAAIHSDLAIGLGAKATETACLIVDDHTRTSIPGLYAAGDVVLGLDQISGAMGQAALAATTIRNDLCAVEQRLR